MRSSFFVLVLFAWGGTSYAQLTSNSPYSSIGIGELGGLDHAVMSGIGNTTITTIDSTTLNFYNPASYNALAAGKPIFSLGVSSRLSNFSESTSGNKHFSNVIALQHFAMGFPIAKHFGLAFGIRPFSRTGYSFSTIELVNSDSLIYTYKGSGGFNEAFTGFSADLIKLDSTRLSIGANFGYLFGSTINSRHAVALQTGNGGGVDTRTIRAQSFYYNLGTYFTQQLNARNRITIAATFTPKQSINTKYSYGRFYSANVNNPAIYDTLFSIEDSIGTITSVPTLSFGIRYSFSVPSSESKRLNSLWSIHASYSKADWTNFRIPFDTNTVRYMNTNRFTFGVELVPEIEYIENKSSTKFYERMRYRIGGYYSTLPYATNGVQVTDFGTTFGIGIPITAQRSLSSMNIGFTIGRRGTTEAAALKEDYYGINIGFSIAPVGDRWFVKRKLN